ncbi:MAG: DUF1800 domain-containing protein [Proteobacteria bacterium]|nr:DUF1800 domain-containing protein [Pseudomonadota bacterium]
MSTNNPLSQLLATVNAKTLTLIGSADGSSATANISAADASRFLAQASMGASREEMARVQNLGYAGWLDAQFALPQTQSRWDWLLAKGFGAAANRNSENGFDAASWCKLLSSPDTLRQRVALALSEIIVVGIDGLSGGWRAFAAAHYQDILENNAFGNYRKLLEDVTLSPAMGEWLTYRNNLKANQATGALPDENYAREIMQLFTIGLVQLNLDGTPKLVGGAPQYTYLQADVMGLARVWTGWDWDFAGGSSATPEFQGRPLRLVPSRSETGQKVFLGTTIAAGTDGKASMGMALDALFNHPNSGPFIGKQLIQRLVTSNPSPAYVGRVASIFNNDGNGVRGNLQAVVKAILLDYEARNTVNNGPAFGKLREPILRFCNWARAYNATSASGAWAVGNTSDPGTRLGQSPLRSPTVFNFFRPGYVPPNTAAGNAGLAAPEFQITNASSVVGYVNFMQRVVSSGIGDVTGDYTSLLPLANNAQALFNEINLVVAAGQISAANLAAMAGAVNGMPANSAAALNRRIYAALLMVLASPEYIVQK